MSTGYPPATRPRANPSRSWRVVRDGADRSAIEETRRVLVHPLPHTEPMHPASKALSGGHRWWRRHDGRNQEAGSPDGAPASLIARFSLPVDLGSLEPQVDGVASTASDLGGRESDRRS